VDATGLESRNTSRYFVARSGREHTARTYTKLTVACDTASHFFAGATVTVGPTNDSPQFPPAMTSAALTVPWDRVSADAAFDSEAHHRFAREELGIRSSVIPVDARGHAGPPVGRYRRQMARRFRPKPEGSRSERVYGQRWQVESAFSRHERRLGSALGGKSDASREREGFLRVLTHNLMLLATAK
jgi:transposase